MTDNKPTGRTPHPATDPHPARAAGADEPPATPRTDDAGLADAMQAVAFALDKKALAPVLLDVRGLCTYASFQLVVSGRSDRQVDAICEGIVVGMKEAGTPPLSTEGKRSGQWALIDFGDLIVHVFHHPVREHYDLEGLWIDAPRVPLDLPADAQVSADDYA
ncbi:MAG: ribosome silencing factor [Kofleriaceae bacterium]